MRSSGRGREAELGRLQCTVVNLRRRLPTLPRRFIIINHRHRRFTNTNSRRPTDKVSRWRRKRGDDSDGNIEKKSKKARNASVVKESLSSYFLIHLFTLLLAVR
ncbi:hypothetical protein KSP40_PGU009646 [Platanthera guangdongensis]|uniref:Uncharacterized protein n=1 Tax=Platanthera guangdongensis TaxID=2320717 RepID=A0ABR2MY59_9ASPA